MQAHPGGEASSANLGHWCLNILSSTELRHSSFRLGCAAGARLVLNPPERARVGLVLIPAFGYEIVECGSPNLERFTTLVRKWFKAGFPFRTGGKTQTVGQQWELTAAETAAYHRSLAQDCAEADLIDDRTWSDLEMERVFRRLTSASRPWERSIFMRCCGSIRPNPPPSKRT